MRLGEALREERRSVIDDVERYTGTFPAFLTNDSTPTINGNISGTLGAGEVVAIYDGATRLGQTTVSAGTWSFTPAALAGGTHNLTAVVESATGTQGLPTAFGFTIDIAGLVLFVVPDGGTDRCKSVDAEASQVAVEFIEEATDRRIAGKGLTNSGDQLGFDLFDNNIIVWHSILLVNMVEPGLDPCLDPSSTLSVCTAR